VSAHRSDALLQLERELVVERATALARIAEALAARLARLGEAGSALRDAPLDRRPALAEAYAALRAEALRWRWYLEVQREALGILRHDDLDRFYPVPAARRDAA
jgi:hypothetical protein